MPTLNDNISLFFKTLQSEDNKKLFKEENRDKIRHTEIENLCTYHSTENAFNFLNKEFNIIKSGERHELKRNMKRNITSIRMMTVLYNAHGKFPQELEAIKFYRMLCLLSGDVDECNYVCALEAFFHFVHDSKQCISEKSVNKLKNITVDKNIKNGKIFLINLAKIFFQTTCPDFQILFEEINQFKITCKDFFDKSTIDSSHARTTLIYYEHVLKVKVFNLANIANFSFNFTENALVMKKLSLRCLDHLAKKTNDKLQLEQVENMTQLWWNINSLLGSMEIIAEFYTLMGIEQESKSFQNDFFFYSLKYSVPYRTETAVRLMMHNDFVYLRLPDLTIRDAQLHQIKNGTKPSGFPSFDDPCLDIDITEYHYGIMNTSKVIFHTPVMKGKNPVKLNVLPIKSFISGVRELEFEDCFLSKSSFRVGLLDIFDVVKSFIWEIELKKRNLYEKKEWEKIFHEPDVCYLDLAKSMSTISLTTPVNSPSDAPISKIKCNAPLRPKAIQPLMVNPAILQRKEMKKKVRHVENACVEIETFHTIFLPTILRDIKYEEPEILGNKCDKKDELSMDYSATSDSPSLIQYLEDHIEKFRYLNVPVIHRPIYQRLALHYLSTDQRKAAYYLSMSIGIGFRQLYHLECSMKSKLFKRWFKAQNRMQMALKNEVEMHSALEKLMPLKWTVLQFSMIDEISISPISSSLLKSSDGGCLGARNCAVLLVTKYQKVIVNGNLELTTETRLIHGFKKTGLQLMDTLEILKCESAKELNETDPETWWFHRFRFDSKLKSLIDQMSKDWFNDEDRMWMMDESNELISEPKILIADRNLCRLPLEHILIRDFAKPHCVTRMPNISCFIGHLVQTRFRNVFNAEPSITRKNLEVDPYSTFFLRSPYNSQHNIKDAVLPSFQAKMSWEGLNEDDIKSIDSKKILSQKEMLIYCGHGAGYQYFIQKSIKVSDSPASVFLFGCQSARMMLEGRSEIYGMIMYYLTYGCPSVTGFLWDVTDKEIDKFSVKMISSWLGKEQEQETKSETYFPVAPMPSYVFSQNTVGAVKLKSLTGNSAVVFGLPTWINESVDVNKINF